MAAEKEKAQKRKKKEKVVVETPHLLRARHRPCGG